jgi:type IV pilus assembly protein PilV
MKSLEKSQRGFSMIEVLVSLIVIGVGMLGLSGLQIVSMKGTSNAHSRNVATMLAFELGERMRANPEGVAGGYYANDDTCTKKLNQCRVSFCTPEEIAHIDVQEVKCGVYKLGEREGGVANLLSGGSLAVSCVGGCDKPKAMHDISISWGELNVHKDQDASNATQSITISILP